MDAKSLSLNTYAKFNSLVDMMISLSLLQRPYPIVFTCQI